MTYTVEEIKELLYKAYDIDEEYADDELGAFLNGKWLSIKNILEVLERGY